MPTVDALPIPYWSAKVWKKDNKADLLADINQIGQFHSILGVGAPYTYNLSSFISDQQALALDNDNYIEIHAGRTMPQTLIASGYVQKVTKTIDSSGMFDVDFDSASIALSDYRALDAMLMPFPHYRNVLHALNGIKNPKGDAEGRIRGAKDGHFGILPRLWRVRWHDPVWHENGHKHGGHRPPGHGDSWFTALESAQLNLQTLAARYNFLTWEPLGNTLENGIINIGTGGERSGLHIWGGEALRYTPGQGGYPFRSNAAIAQHHKIAVIDQPQFVSNRDQICNLVWCSAAGSSTDSITLSSYWDKAPDKMGIQWDDSHPYTGIAPKNGRTYWLHPEQVKHWAGQEYWLIASQRQDSSFEYGVVDMTSTGLYGVHEQPLGHGAKKVIDPHELLSAGLGMVDYMADPVDTFTFPVWHPRTSDSAVPFRILPTQRIEVHYKGSVPGYVLDSDSTSDTYGQYVPSGESVYLEWPGTTDPLKIRKLSTCIQIEESYDATNGYRATYTCGHGKTRLRHWQDQLARELEHEIHHPDLAPGSSTIHDIGRWPFLFSQNPSAWETQDGTEEVLTPGSIIVSDVHHDKFFGQHHAVSYTATIHGWHQMLDFWLAKPYGHDIINPDPGNDENGNPIWYLVFRLAMIGSGWRTGFYKTKDGTTFHHKGTHPHKGISRMWAPDDYHVRVSFTGGHYHAHVHRSATGKHSPHQHHHHVAKWHDRNLEIYFDHTRGAIGWNLRGGHVNATLKHLKLAPVHV